MRKKHKVKKKYILQPRVIRHTKNFNSNSGLSPHDMFYPLHLLASPAQGAAYQPQTLLALLHGDCVDMFTVPM